MIKAPYCHPAMIRCLKINTEVVIMVTIVVVPKIYFYAYHNFLSVKKHKVQEENTFLLFNTIDVFYFIQGTILPTPNIIKQSAVHILPG